MKANAHAQNVLGYLKGTTVSTLFPTLSATSPDASAYVYLALVGASGASGIGGTFNPNDPSTWQEINNTAASSAKTEDGSDMTNYFRFPVRFGSITTSGSGSARVATMTASHVTGTLDGTTWTTSTGQTAWPALNRQWTLDAVVICTSPTTALSTCGLRCADVQNVTFEQNSQPAVTPSNITCTEQ